ncbi:MAG: hypothetical protein ACTSUV_00140 [Candidatus Ranarchaeia archaeon]
MSLELGLVEVAKAITELVLGFVLINKWKKSFNRMYTDLPFLFGLSIVMVGLGESMDAVMDLGLIMYSVEIFKIRWLFLVAMMGFMLFALTNIWIHNRKVLKTIIPVLFSGSWLLISLILPDRASLYQVLIIYLGVFLVPFVITFSLLYIHKRLPEVNSGMLLLGIFIMMIGQFSKSAFLLIGILWISELIDLFGFVFISYGFIKPPKWALKSKVENYGEE